MMNLLTQQLLIALRDAKTQTFRNELFSRIQKEKERK